MRRYPGGGAFALFFHPHPRAFATQNKKSVNARGLARGGGMGAAGIDWCIIIPTFFKIDFEQALSPRCAKLYIDYARIN